MSGHFHRTQSGEVMPCTDTKRTTKDLKNKLQHKEIRAVSRRMKQMQMQMQIIYSHVTTDLEQDELVTSGTLIPPLPNIESKCVCLQKEFKKKEIKSVNLIGLN